MAQLTIENINKIVNVVCTHLCKWPQKLKAIDELANRCDNCPLTAELLAQHDEEESEAQK